VHTYHFESSWESNDGLRLFAQGWEPEAAPKAVVCLVHGLGDHSGRYAHVSAHLVEHGYAVLAFDRRGHGKSEGLRGHADGYDVLLQEIDLLLQNAARRYPGLPRFLYGQSLGGAVVINYALSRKPDVAGVVSTSPFLRTTVPTPAWKLALGKVTYNLCPTLRLGNGVDPGGLSHDAAAVRAFRADPLVHDRISARMGLDIMRKGEEASTQAARFPLPLLLMHGNSDPITSFEASRRFAERAPSDLCTFVAWDGLYHEMHNEPQQAEVLNTITAWLDRILAVQEQPGSAFLEQTTANPGEGEKRQ
jgi:alpha-beta hydrolase superfamily lysophospholipase